MRTPPWDRHCGCASPACGWTGRLSRPWWTARAPGSTCSPGPKAGGGPSSTWSSPPTPRPSANSRWKTASWRRSSWRGARRRGPASRPGWGAARDGAARWEGTIELDRDNHRGRTLLRPRLTAAVGGAHRVVAGPDAWSVFFDAPSFLPLGGRLRVRWADFRAPDADPVARQFPDATHVVAFGAGEEPPEVLLNVAFDGLQALLGDGGREPAARAVAELLRSAIARDVWTQLLAAALAAVRADGESGRASWPAAEWQREVLRRVLPCVAPGRPLPELLGLAATEWRSHPGAAEFQARAGAAIGDIVRAQRGGAAAGSGGPGGRCGMDDLLKGLNPAARALASDRSFRAGMVAAIEAGPYVVEDLGLGRAIGLGPLRAVVGRAMRAARPAETDAWLAPRVHATIRLTRREAADFRLWDYLTVVALPGYVRWRWGDAGGDGAPAAIDRFVGDAAENALARLWWAAELTRDGLDYGPTMRALASPWFDPAWLGLGVMQHRAAAQAVAARLADDGAGTAAAVRALDLTLRAVALDAVAPSVPPDADAVREWCAERPDETLMMTRPPVGPDEAPASATDVAAVRTLLDERAGHGAAMTAAGPGRRRRRRRT